MRPVSMQADERLAISSQARPQKQDQRGHSGLEAEPPRGIVHFVRTHRPAVLGVLGMLLVLGAWEASAALRIIDPTYSSRPSEVVVAAKDYFASGEAIDAIGVSAQEFVLGFALALAVGLVLGLAIGWWRWLGELFDPLISFGYAIPRIALVPLFVAWFGIGLTSKVVTIFGVAVFPILLNTISGVRMTDPGLIRLARSFGASNAQLFRTVVLPGAVPQIVTGVRLGIGLGLVGMVAAEFLAASSAGLGYTILTAGTNFEIAKVYVAMFIVAGAGMILTALVGILERRVDRWRPERQS